jgi:hypothetical protein
MPEQIPHQQLQAAESSARRRRTDKLLRELRGTRPLTPQQREELARAVASIPVVTP